jgi:adenosylhomocysteine nucleosidase
MIRVAIIAAMAGELKPLVRGWRHERRNGVDLWRYRRDDAEWIAACAGAGQQAAARAFAEIEKNGPIHLAISTGWAGSLSCELQTGEAYRVGGVIDEQTGERFSISGCLGEPWLVTSSKVANAAEKQRLASTYGAGLVDMEAAAIARLAVARGIPFHCIKGVSDGLTDNLPDFNRFLSPQGQLQMARLLLYVLPRPWRWPALIRMGENSSRASQAIRNVLLEDLDKPGAFGK